MPRSGRTRFASPPGLWTGAPWSANAGERPDTASTAIAAARSTGVARREPHPPAPLRKAAKKLMLTSQKFSWGWPPADLQTLQHPLSPTKRGIYIRDRGDVSNHGGDAVRPGETRSGKVLSSAEHGRRRAHRAAGGSAEDHHARGRDPRRRRPRAPRSIGRPGPGVGGQVRPRSLPRPLSHPRGVAGRPAHARVCAVRGEHHDRPWARLPRVAGPSDAGRRSRRWADRVLGDLPGLAGAAIAAFAWFRFRGPSLGAAVAAGLASLHPLPAFTSARAMSDEFCAALGFAGLLAWRCAESDSSRRWSWAVASGLALGGAILTRSSAVLFLLAIVAVALLARSVSRLLVVVVVLALVPSAAWSVRSSVLEGRPVFVHSLTAFNFWLGESQDRFGFAPDFGAVANASQRIAGGGRRPQPRRRKRPVARHPSPGAERRDRDDAEPVRVATDRSTPRRLCGPRLCGGSGGSGSGPKHGRAPCNSLSSLSRSSCSRRSARSRGCEGGATRGRTSSHSQ